MESDDKARTRQQNRALHLYFRLVAEELNNAGYDMRKSLDILKSGADIPWNDKTVKNYLWRKIQETQLQKESTTELTTKEIDVVFDTMNRFLGEKFGISIPFPSIDELFYQEKKKKN